MANMNMKYTDGVLREDFDSKSKPDFPLVDASTRQIKALRWKIDLMLMPLLAFCYMLQFMDKLALSYGSVLGLIKDTGFKGSEYSWTSSIFYFGYLFWSFPSAYLSVKLPIGKYLSASVFIWSVILMAHAACHDFTALMCVRFFLGTAEAAVAPGFSLVTGLWYTRKEHPLRHGIWFSGNAMANIIGAAIAYGVGEIRSDLSPWQYLFLIFGAITAFWTIVMFCLLPDHQSTAWWLRDDERKIALSRVAHNKTSVKASNKFKLKHLLEGLFDPQCLLLYLHTFTINIANGGLASFGTLIIQGFGFKGLDSLLLQMPAGASQLIFIIVACTVGSQIKHTRILIRFALDLISVLGFALMYASDTSNRAGRMAGYCISVAFWREFCLELGFGLQQRRRLHEEGSSNVAGFTTKATANAGVVIMYCVGNIVGPQFFSTDDAPKYTEGITASLAGLCIGAFFIALLGLWYWYENRRRNGQYGAEDVIAATEKRDELLKELLSLDKTDRENAERFRYLL